jgi:hypothetical protein
VSYIRPYIDESVEKQGMLAGDRSEVRANRTGAHRLNLIRMAGQGRATDRETVSGMVSPVNAPKRM